MYPQGAPQYPNPNQVPQPQQEYGPPINLDTPVPWYGPAYPYQPQPIVFVNNQKPSFNHGIHILLDIMTCFLWTPVHLLLWILHGRG